MPTRTSSMMTWVATAALMIAGCSSKTTSGGTPDMATGGGGAGGSGGGGSGGGGGGGAGGGGGGGGGGGTGSGNGVTGDVGGTPFGTVATAWFIGKPDAASTTVIYLFNKAVDCHDPAIKFGMLAWDMNLPANTQFVEVKAYGPTPAVSPPTPKGDYTVTTAMNPTVNEASINHSTAAGGGAASNETISASGKITISNITTTKVTGTFNATFPTPPGGALTGTFDVGICDIGVEP